MPGVAGTWAFCERQAQPPALRPAAGRPWAGYRHRVPGGETPDGL